MSNKIYALFSFLRDFFLHITCNHFTDHFMSNKMTTIKRREGSKRTACLNQEDKYIAILHTQFGELIKYIIYFEAYIFTCTSLSMYIHVNNLCAMLL